MKLSIGVKISIGYGLVLVSLLLIGVVSFHNLKQLNSDSEWVEHTALVLQKMESLSAHLTEAESSQRGFLLTRLPGLLNRFDELSPFVLDDLQQIRTLTKDNASQQANLDDLEPVLAERMELLQRVLHIFQAKGKIGLDEVALFAKGQQDMEFCRLTIQKMEAQESRLLADRKERATSAQSLTGLTITWGTLAAFLIVALASWIIVRGISSSLRTLTNAATKIGAGDYSKRADVIARDEIGQLATVFNQMADQVEQRQDQLAKQEWLKGNLAHFNSLFQGKRSLQEVCQTLVSQLAAILDTRRASLYLAQSVPGTSGGKPQFALRWQAGFAVPEERRAIRPGEGLLGQCFLEKKPFFIDDVPRDYFTIGSTLGEALPRSLVLLPILFEDKAKGVLELAFFRELTELQKNFLVQLLNGFGLVLSAIEANLRTEELLTQAEILSSNLQTQQEELRQTNEELQQTNEELGQANTELEERTRRLDEQRVEMERKNREIEEAQQALEEKAGQLAQTSKYKSEFLANMSHELRTPLNSLLILSNILVENSERNLSEKQIQYAETIRGAGNDLLQLINDILDLAKIESGTVGIEIGDLVYVDLAHSIERAFRPMAEAKKLDFTIDLDPNLPDSLRTDVRRVHQVVKNLLSNAFKFTEQGVVHLKVGIAPNGEIAFSVKDSGIGISEEKQQIIFEAFQQAESGTARRYGGTGLGLSISREIARLLGGSLRVSSTLGQGSTFILTLPATLAAASDAAAPSPQRPASAWEPKPRIGHGHAPAASAQPQELASESGGVEDDRANISPEDLVLLVVEDDANFAGLMADFAHGKGFKVVITRQAGSVPLLAERFKPAAITLDLGLPDREGWVVLDQLKHSAATRHIPVHIMSVREERERGLKLGAVSYLKKPVTKEQIDGMLGQVKEFAARSVKNLLIVEDDERQRKSLIELIGNGDVVTTAVGTGLAALAAIEEKHYDCIILDLGLPDIGGLDLIRRIKDHPGGENLPIIIYTGRSLTEAEERDLKQFSEAIIIKNVKSPERLLDETALFLHRVQSKLPERKRQAIELARQEDSILAEQAVLIVDDDPRNIFSITAGLEQYRMQVLYANNGREGIEMVEKHPEIRAVLMDIMMPEMDGFEAMRRIRANPKYHDLPILAITAKAMKGDREKCLDAGASDYVTKPVDMEQLRSLLRVWLYK
ncbi:response regulator [Verrucomicrobium sp. GAS474]|uniref:response regulator n=1 Tax=Verrucomicrobium sp. GAS474 TaxID=1882831 RepID=UPI00138FC5A8|nr:response regulator [Verrucomicrobium sp. GAS474]